MEWRSDGVLVLTSAQHSKTPILHHSTSSVRECKAARTAGFSTRPKPSCPAIAPSDGGCESGHGCRFKIRIPKVEIRRNTESPNLPIRARSWNLGSRSVFGIRFSDLATPLCLSSYRAGFVNPYSSVRVRSEHPRVAAQKQPCESRMFSGFPPLDGGLAAAGFNLISKGRVPPPPGLNKYVGTMWKSSLPQERRAI
jgi:hypothetical protein